MVDESSSSGAARTAVEVFDQPRQHEVTTFRFRCGARTKGSGTLNRAAAQELKVSYHMLLTTYNNIRVI